MGASSGLNCLVSPRKDWVMIGGWYEEDNTVIGSKYCIIYTT